MKYIIILGDGMADEPIAELAGKTPLQYAQTPAMDEIARLGVSGMLSTVPEGFIPGSEIANMVVLGYDVRKEFEGRGSLEAASMGVAIADGEMAIRCNLICIENGRIKNHSAGHISTAEAEALIAALQKELGNDVFTFRSGVSYRHLLLMKGGDKRILCTPPHDVPGTPFADVMIKPETEEAKPTADRLNQLILDSQRILEHHPVNIARREAGKDPANSIWPWSAGYRPKMRTLTERYHLNSGAVISAVDLIKGIGVYAGLESIAVEGATGLFDTNYEGKAAAAIEALRKHDFVFLHVEASDEAGHEGNVDLKVKTIENLDARIVRPVFEEVHSWSEPVTIAVLPDHPTPCRLKTHTREAVPFIIYNPTRNPDNVTHYSEADAKQGGYGLLVGEEFMQRLME